MDAECQKCGSYYAVRENCEPTPFCDECAHSEVERLACKIAELTQLLESADAGTQRPGAQGAERRELSDRRPKI